MDLFWLPLAFLSAFFAALVTIFAKLGLANIDPSVATFLRVLVMSVFLFLVMAFSGKLSLSIPSFKDWVLIILCGLAGAISWLFYFWALKFGPAARVATIDRLSLVIIAILAALVLGEKFSWLSLLGIVLVMSGIYLLTFK